MGASDLRRVVTTLTVVAGLAQPMSASAEPKAKAPAPTKADAGLGEADEVTDEAPGRALVADDGAEPPPDPLGPDAKLDRWCAPELDVLSNEVCAYAPKREATGPRTLVVFLHGVVKPETSWQWAQQRGLARAADAHGFTVIMPRGRTGIGPKGMESWWTWPTSQSAQGEVEDEIVAEWATAKSELEAKGGAFDRVWIFGFSNGAYYATSLAVRAKLEQANGFAVFAGGSGASYVAKAARGQKRRAPIFVAWGGKDPAHGDQVELAKLLRSARWPSKSEGAKRAGHAMTDHQVASAVRFLSRPPLDDGPKGPHARGEGALPKKAKKRSAK